jgi:hypothetical protein
LYDVPANCVKRNNLSGQRKTEKGNIATPHGRRWQKEGKEHCIELFIA